MKDIKKITLNDEQITLNNSQNAVSNFAQVLPSGSGSGSGSGNGNNVTSPEFMLHTSKQIKIEDFIWTVGVTVFVQITVKYVYDEDLKELCFSSAKLIYKDLSVTIIGTTNVVGTTAYVSLDHDSPGEPYIPNPVEFDYYGYFDISAGKYKVKGFAVPVNPDDKSINAFPQEFDMSLKLYIFYASSPDLGVFGIYGELF